MSDFSRENLMDVEGLEIVRIEFDNELERVRREVAEARLDLIEVGLIELRDD